MTKSASEAYSIIESAQDVAPILLLLEEIDSFDDDARSHLTALTLQTLQDMDYHAFAEVAIDIAFRLSDLDSYFAQEQIATWVESHSADTRNEIIDRLIAYLAPDRSEATVIRAIDILNTIGFRSELIDEHLHFLLGHASVRVRDAALWSLTWLGSSDTAELEAAVRKRLENPKDLSDSDAKCLRILRSISLLEPMLKAYKGYSTDDTVLTTMMRALADTAWEHGGHAGTIWQILIDRPRELIEKHINIAGDISSEFDDKAVPDYFLRQLLPSYISEFAPDTGRIPHYSPYLRLKELLLPEAIAGLRLSTIREDPDLIETLEDAATLDTGSQNFWQSGRTIQKENAWEVALRLGLSALHSWFPRSLEELNPFIKGNIAEIAGFIRAESAVAALRKTVTTLDIHPILRNQALLALGRIGNEAALDSLLNVVLPDKNIPLDWVYALTVATITTCNIESLVRCLEDSDADASLQIAVSGALELVSGINRELTRPFQQRLNTIVRSETSRSERFISHLLLALGNFALDEETLGTVLDIAYESPINSHVVRAAIVLAQNDKLLDYPDILTKLGTVKVDTRWHTTRKLSYDETTVVGILYNKHPDSFLTAVRDILVNNEENSLYQILGAVNLPAAESAQSPLIEVLSQKIEETIGSITIHVDLIDTFARWAPDLFVDMIEKHDMTRLPSHVRNALAVSMRHPMAHDETNSRASNIIKSLLTDASREVRGQAALLLSEYANEVISEAALSLCDSPMPFERICGVEAAARSFGTEVFQNIRTRMSHDPELKVRLASNFANRARRRSDLSSFYLSKIEEANSDNVLDLWHFGGALIEVGDETTVRKLRAHASNALLAPSKSAWIFWLADKVEAKAKHRANSTDRD